MVIPVAVTLERLQVHYPWVHRILVLYHPVYSAKFIPEAEAMQSGYELVALPTSSPQEVNRLLNSMQAIQREGYIHITTAIYGILAIFAYLFVVNTGMFTLNFVRSVNG